MSKQKTQGKITAEIEALEACKPKVRKSNFFGDNLHSAIDAQIKVLTEHMSEDEIYDEWEDPDDHDHNRNIIDSALDALAWREGEDRPDAERESLEAGWLDIGLG